MWKPQHLFTLGSKRPASSLECSNLPCSYGFEHFSITPYSSPLTLSTLPRSQYLDPKLPLKRGESVAPRPEDHLRKQSWELVAAYLDARVAGKVRMQGMLAKVGGRGGEASI